MRRTLCAPCLKSWSETYVLSGASRRGLQNSDRIRRRYKGYIAPAGGQARPITGFYAEMLKKSPSKVQPDPIPSLPPSLPEAQREPAFKKASIIFGSRIALDERRQEIAAASQTVAGIIVPPRPDEPDNCCMSGCINCVWDMYRDEMEEWADKSAQARRAMQTQRQEGKASGSMVATSGTPSHVAVSMDDDGGGSETNWNEEVEQERLFDDIPVGIREFMRTEKKLKQMQLKAQGSAV